MTQYVRNPTVEAAPMRGETVLYDSATNKFCVLNPTAAFMWDLLESPRTESEIVTEICTGFEGADEEKVEHDVQAAMQQFTELSMVAPAVAQ